MHLKILHQTNHYIVVIKPAGTLSVPARFSHDERPVVGKILETQLNQQIYPVHRLDFEVSGVMIYALDQKLHQLLSMAFEKHEVQKTYRAVAENPDNNFEWQHWKSLLVKGKKRTFEAPYGKSSHTKAKCISNLKNNCSLWELKPITGRSHQLRFELMKHQHVIVGDKLYGSKIVFKENQIALCSTKIEIPNSLQVHPWNLEGFYELNENEIAQLLPSTT